MLLHVEYGIIRKTPRSRAKFFLERLSDNYMENLKKHIKWALARGNQNNFWNLNNGQSSKEDRSQAHLQEIP